MPSPLARQLRLKRAIEAKEVDFTTALGRDDLDGLKEVRKVFAPGNATTILSFNVAPTSVRRRSRPVSAPARSRQPGCPGPGPAPPSA